jgi:hypothetical protein
VAQAAHALKGAVCNLTDKAAFRATVELETLARDGDLIHADRAFQKLELEMRQLTEALVTYTKPGGDKAFAATN